MSRSCSKFEGTVCATNSTFWPDNHWGPLIVGFICKSPVAAIILEFLPLALELCLILFRAEGIEELALTLHPAGDEVLSDLPEYRPTFFGVGI